MKKGGNTENVVEVVESSRDRKTRVVREGKAVDVTDCGKVRKDGDGQVRKW